MLQLLLFSNLTNSSNVDSQYSNLLSINIGTNCVAATQCNTAEIITYNPNMRKIMSLTAKKNHYTGY